MKGWPPTLTHLRYSADCGYASLPPCNGESHHRIWAAAMSGSPYRRRCITSGPKVANRLTWAAPGTHGHELCWLPGRARAGLVARGRLAPTKTAVRTSRRRLLKDAVFRAQDAPADDAAAGFPAPGELPRAITGTVRDISPHVLVIGNGGSDTRMTLTAGATAWRGGPLDPAGGHPGGHVGGRLHRPPCGRGDPSGADTRRV